MMQLSRLALRHKLFLGLAIVGAVSLVAVYLLATQFILADVKAFLVSENAALARGLTEQLADFYDDRSGWEGVEEVFDNSTDPGWRRGGGMHDSAIGRFQWGNHVLLTDPTGLVLYASSEEIAHERLSSSTLSKGLSILSEGKEVGLLFTGAMLNRFTGLEEELLASVRRSVALTALISLVVATAVGLLLLRLVTAPFGRLISAAQSISSGDLSERISVETRDEIGKLSQVLDDLRRSLTRSEEARRHMLADIAHELRNPLAILRAKVEAMLDGLQPTSEENIGSLGRRLEHLSHLVDQLQEMALAEAGELRLDLRPVDLKELLHEAESDARALFASEKRAFALEMTDPLPSVCADRRRLLQILWNLLSNALRHTAPGDRVTLRAEAHDGHLLIEVRDTGEGMDEEALAHLFDRFSRGERARASEGLGLGLAITRELVRAHHGEIRVESAPGKGTSVFVILPSRCPD
jgi:signal transduction histidine kinase